MSERIQTEFGTIVISEEAQESLKKAPQSDGKAESADITPPDTETFHQAAKAVFDGTDVRH